MLKQSISNAQLAMPKLPPQVGIMRDDFKRIHANYMVVKIHIGRWRARTNLTLADLGLPANTELNDNFKDLISLGDKFLLPTIPASSQYFDRKKPNRTYSAALDAIESTARWTMRQKTVPLYWGNALPLASYEAFNQMIHTEFRDEFMAMADELCGNQREWQQHIDRLKEEYRAFAQRSEERFRVLRREIRNSDLLPDEPGAFFDKMWENIRNLIPDAKTFRDSFEFQVQYDFLDFTPWADASMRERLLDDLKTNGSTRAEIDAYEKSKATWEKIFDEKARKADELRDQMLGDLAKFFNNLVYQTLVECLESMQKNNGMLVGPVSKKLRNLWGSISQHVMSPNSDEQAIYARLRELSIADDLAPADIEKTMRDIAIVAKDTLMQLQEAPRAARELGIPDMPTIQEVRAARVALDAPVFDDAGMLIGARQPRAL